MKNETVGVLMAVKDEIDIIEHNINYLSTQDLDLICVYDNNSTDGTREKLNWLSDIHDELLVLNDSSVGYCEADKISKWISEIFQEDIDVVIPIAADEIWYSKNPNCTLGGAIRATDADIFVAESNDFVPSILDDFGEPNFIKRMTHRKDITNSFNNMAFNYSPEFWFDNESRNVLNHPGERAYDVLGIRRYQYRTYRQFQKNFPDNFRVPLLCWREYCEVALVKDSFIAKNYS